MKSACRGFNQLRTTRVAGWGLVGWPGELVPKKAVFRPELCWLIIWTFISHLELLCPNLNILYPTLNFYIPLNRLLFPCWCMAPAKNFAHPPFFSSKALQNGSHNIKMFTCEVCYYKYLIMRVLFIIFLFDLRCKSFSSRLHFNSQQFYSQLNSYKIIRSTKFWLTGYHSYDFRR